jgi:cyclophilin family peptidyl-prolyl cis-trans isomerase
MFLFRLIAVLALAGPAWAGSLAQFHTPLGDWVLELYDEDKPVTVENFKRYIREGRFLGSFVQRHEPGFVIQGGGFAVTGRGTPTAQLVAIPTYGPITNEYQAGRIYSNQYGTIAMARVGGQTNSATSQWFISLTNNAFLDGVDGGFTVFGRRLLGTNVLNRFHPPVPAGGLFRAQVPGNPSLATIPVLKTPPTLDDLVFTDISLPAWPNLRIELLPGGARRLSWTSLSNFVNHVEFAESARGPHQILISTTGTGQLMQVEDAAPAPLRFYRVRVE